MFFIYILKLRTARYYTGMTNDLKLRFWKHHNGLGPSYTKTRRPLKLVYFEMCDTKREALKRERQIKDYSQKKKEDLIDNMSEERKKQIEHLNETIKTTWKEP
ncbi:MAG: GIY-YIG nuclease family protein [Patescibacteria group bacterium]|nr:GIY-YIG nuclease family protein [Patescibacteria group bacterium]